MSKKQHWHLGFPRTQVDTIKLCVSQVATKLAINNGNLT